jgi:MFS family permease
VTGLVEETGGVWAPARRRLTVGLVLTVTLVAFESLAVSTVMPEVSDDLGGLGLYGWVFSGFFLGNLVGALMAGAAADRRGTAPPFVLGLALFALGVALAGAAPSMAVLVAARVLQGFGAGAIPAVAYTSVGRAYPPAIRPRVFAVFSSAWIIPGLLGPAAASALEHALSWRAVFWAILPLVLAAAVMTVPALRAAEVPAPPAAGDDTRADETKRTRLAVLLAVGVGLVMAAPQAELVLLAALLVVGGVPLAVSAFLRLVPAGTLRAADGLPAAIASRGLLTFAFFGTDAFIPLAVTDARGQDTWVAGLALTVGTVTWTMASWVQQHRIHRDGPRRLVTIGLLLAASGIGGGVLLLHGIPMPLGIACWGVAGFGIGLAYAPLSVTVLGLATPGSEGRASSSLQLCDVLGVAIGTGITGAVVELGDGRGWDVASSLTIGFTMMAAVAVVGAVAARRLPDRLNT